MRNISSEVSDYVLFENLGKNIFDSLNVMKVAVVQEVDWEKQEVSVKVAMKKKIPVKNGYELDEADYLVRVPYISLGGGTSYLSFPISKGDECIVIFSDFAIQNWRDTGEFLPANEVRKHDVCDGIAIIGVRNATRLIKNYSQYVKLMMTDTSYLEVKESSISLNSVYNIDLITSGESGGTGCNIVADNTSMSKDAYIANNTDIGNDLLVENDTTINNNLTVHNNTQMDMNLNVDGNVTFTKNLATTLNTESATYSTGGTPGITGVFINAAGQKLIFTNGLITAIQ